MLMVKFYTVLIVILMICALYKEIRECFIYPWIKTRNMPDYDKEKWLESYYSNLGEGDSD